MVFRSVRNPIFLGLGTAAITALSAAVPVAVSANPSVPSPSDPPISPAETVSPSPSDPPQGPSLSPKLFVVLTQPGTAMHGGDSVSVSVHVYSTEVNATETEIRFAASSNAGLTPRCDDRQGNTCELGTVDAEGKFLSATVTIPKSMTSGSVTLTATASASGAATKEALTKIAVARRPAAGTPSTGGSGGTGGTGSPTGSTGIGGVGNTGVTPPLADPGFVPASPAGVLQSPQVALPQIAPQAPGVAPAAAAAVSPNTLRSGGIPGSQELTFERLASTQAAWLAALLVAFSLLMTQLRMVRPYNTRWTGDHRRPRHGLFQR